MLKHFTQHQRDEAVRIGTEGDWREWIVDESDIDAVLNHGCYFDEKAGNRVVSFCKQFLRHSKGRWAGKPFVLLDWEREIVMRLFGWKQPDGTRRYRVAYCEVPKKQGKSTLAAAIAIYMLTGDNEPGAQVYGAAVDRDQAGIVFQEAAAMVRKSPSLSKRLEVIDSRKTIHYRSTESFYRVLSADAYRQEGLNASALIIDELHAHKNRQMWDTLRFSGAARTQPLIFVITTAGVERESIGWEEHELGRQIADGTVLSYQRLAYIRGAQPGDDWTDAEVWKRANPSYGVTVQEPEIRQACEEAQAAASKQNSFKRYRLNMWVAQAERWLDANDWAACYAQPTDLGGWRCYGGLDMGKSRDLSAFCIAFPPQGAESSENGIWRFRWHFWVPEEKILEASRRDNVPYLDWVNAGWITPTPGNVIDPPYVRKWIVDAADQYDFIEVGYDPWNAIESAVELRDQHGVPMVEVRQGYKSLSEPSKLFERLIHSRRLHHDGNPVMAWHVDNVELARDINDNIRPAHGAETKRIDGVTAAVIALARAVVNPDDGGSVYDERGIFSVAIGEDE